MTSNAFNALLNEQVEYIDFFLFILRNEESTHDWRGGVNRETHYIAVRIIVVRVYLMEEAIYRLLSIIKVKTWPNPRGTTQIIMITWPFETLNSFRE